MEKHMRKGRLISILAAIGLLTAVATGAQAATGGATSVAVRAGTSGPSVGALEPGSFGAVTLNGQDQVTHASLSRSEEHTSELQSRLHLVCRLLLEKKNKKHTTATK